MVQPINYPALLAMCNQLIQADGQLASLVRTVNGVQTFRDCWCVETSYDPRDPMTALANPTARTFFIAAGLGGVPAMPPNNEIDQLFTYVQPITSTAGATVYEKLAFKEPAKRYAPNGSVLVWSIEVLR
jgi:hypothetical protein